jgi:CHAD domain-containing protein
MNGELTDKWIQGVTSSDRPSDVAVRTLQVRLGAVQYYLPLAAKKANEDVEYVHQLRVSTRRATAALRLYADRLPRRQSSWMKKQLKRVRRAANDAREADVLIERLSEKESCSATRRWLKAVRRERAKAQKSIVKVHERLSHDDQFARRVDKLLQRVGAHGKVTAMTQEDTFGEWSRTQLRPVVELFFAAVPDDHTDEAALHRFRIRGKYLRYDLELLAGAFPDDELTSLYATIETMQDRLGEINDLATAKGRLREKIESASNPKKETAWRRLLLDEQAQYDQACQAFWEWCGPRTIQDLRDGFEKLLSSNVNGPAHQRLLVHQ